MGKKLIAATGIAVLIILNVYFLGAFVAWELNPAEWASVDRFICVLIGLFLMSQLARATKEVE